jgi:predicted secreted protein
MTIFEGVVAFILIWWTVIFMVLPWGVRADENRQPEQGHGPGAPANPMILRKVLITTALTVVIWAVIDILVIEHVIDFLGFARDMAQQDLNRQ